MATSERISSGQPNDDALSVQAVLMGDVSAYADLYDRYAILVRTVCHDVTGDLSQAQDLSQEVFLCAYMRLGDLRHHDRFGAWVVGIARKVCKQWLRGRLRARKRLLDVAGMKDCFAHSPETDDSIDQLSKAIRSLPEKERLAVHTFYLMDQSAEKARLLLGLSRSGLYRVLERARKRLAKELREHREQAP